MVTTVAGYVLRAGNREVTASFYAALGLNPSQHRHGAGPPHIEFGPVDETCTLEIYTRSESFPRDAIMLNVDSIDVALHVAARFGIRATTDVGSTAGASFVYVTDPDGRPVLLLEKTA